MNEHEIKQEARKAFEFLIKHFEDYADKFEAEDSEFRYTQGLVSGLRHAALMANIKLEYFNSITQTYKYELSTSL